MNIARPLLKGIENHGVHQFDDGTGVLGDLFDGEHFFAVLILPNQHGLEVGLHLAEDLGGSFAFFKRLQDGGPRRYAELQRPVKHQLQLVDGRQVGRVGHHNRQVPLTVLNRNEGIAVHQLHGNGLIVRRIDAKLIQGIKRDLVLLRQEPGQSLFRQ